MRGPCTAQALGRPAASAAQRRAGQHAAKRQTNEGAGVVTRGRGEERESELDELTQESLYLHIYRNTNGLFSVTSISFCDDVGEGGHLHTENVYHVI